MSLTGHQIVFTGTPKHEQTVFTGRLTGNLSFTWAPSAATPEFVFSNGLSTTTGRHLVDNEANTEGQFNSGDCNVRTNRVKWTGLACLSKEGSYGCWMRAASTTYGDLTVRKGTLGFLSSGSWANATNITVLGTGILKVAGAGCAVLLK